MTIGEMAKSMLLKLEWFDTRFPRIPVNVQVKYFLCTNQRGPFINNSHSISLKEIISIYLETNRCATKPEKEPI